MEEGSSKKQNLLTKTQFMFIIFGGIVGTGILSLPNDVVKFAYQDGWISAAIGGVYPLYVVLLGSYISKNFPEDTILVLSKRYMGFFLGGILNFIFLTSFIYYSAMITRIYVNLVNNFVVGFLTPFKMIIIVFLVTLYAAFKGLKVIGKISEINFYIMLVLILSSVPALKAADITNVCPVFDVGIESILYGSMTAVFAYSGAEIILITYPFMKEKNKVLSLSFVIVFLVIIIYIWVVFVTIYYLGSEVVIKSYWSFLLVTESVTISVINNYRYIFIFLWSLVAFKSCAMNCYASIYILKDFLKKIKVKILCFIMYPIFVALTFQFGNEITRQRISKYATKGYVLFDVFYIAVISGFVFFRRKRCVE
ncbi:GerAB/ArcD/ProY family transporter [Clostridiaceae bacterium UIB06]|uniref:GerAB/ArcD/ProY family transporter n=1 Tax=Clostridium thailandense TaxID=2794346 RepID=A0A949U1N0_9CLOT|nr:GerAB/ArcD/ProY family transporter [Clostridium thailandense]MBV7276728.1 GerAB/ArcD/ProY family transporter [Clostridium thailandense]MCH5138037.1 GerAB/ArcD/ProY family transporter [Clostridiaceae bacterium UIB06]